MQKFWYHSPVRFYKSIEELEDMTNPQNTQYYGHKNPYPLEYNSYHRFLIPNYQNEVPEDKELQLWLVGDEEEQIPCRFGVYQNKLISVTFICYEIYLFGHFQIRTEDGDVLFYSNCVRFVDSTEDDGRKFIRIATKHTYAKNMFAFADQQHDWMVTNLPGYCLGEFSVDEEVDSGQSGNMESTVINDALLEESVSYLFQIEGDNNIMTFISVHSVNNDFYIDGTKRTRKEKPEVEELSAAVTFKFTNQKNENGFNILLDEDEIFDDAFTKMLANGEKTAVYTYNSNYIIPIENA